MLPTSCKENKKEQNMSKWEIHYYRFYFFSLPFSFFVFLLLKNATLKWYENCIWHNQDWSLYNKPKVKNLLLHFQSFISLSFYLSLLCIYFISFFLFFLLWVKCRKNEHERKLMSKKWRRIISHFPRFNSKLTFLPPIFSFSLSFPSIVSFFCRFKLSLQRKFNFNVDLLYHPGFFSFSFTLSTLLALCLSFSRLSPSSNLFLLLCKSEKKEEK